MIVFYWYPKCSTCRNAKKWLVDHEVPHQAIDIVEEHPSKETLAEIHQASGLPIQKFFNTSGMKYRELGLKDVVKNASLDALLTILASDGMLIKRPLVRDGQQVLLGFKPEQYEKTWGNEEG